MRPRMAFFHQKVAYLVHGFSQHRHQIFQYTLALKPAYKMSSSLVTPNAGKLVKVELELQRMKW